MHSRGESKKETDRSSLLARISEKHLKINEKNHHVG